MKFRRTKWTPSEADLVAEFYHHARLAGLEVHLEVKLPSPVYHRSKNMRADAVVVQEDEILCVVEAKTPGSPIPTAGRQFNAYKQLERDHGIPTLWLNEWDQPVELVIEILRMARKRRDDCCDRAEIGKQEPGKSDALQVMVDGA